MAIETVAKLIAQARVLLQDTLASGYRYSDDELLQNLNIGLLEARRLRPDLFLTSLSAVDVTPEYVAVNTTALAIDQQYRLPLLYYVVGMVQLRDEEDTQDARASALMVKFSDQLTGIVGR